MISLLIDTTTSNLMVSIIKDQDVLSIPKKTTVSKISINKLFVFKKEIDISIFMLCAIVNTVVGVVALKLDINLYGKIYAYINPLNIIGALYLFLFFTKIGPVIIPAVSNVIK